MKKELIAEELGPDTARQIHQSVFGYSCFRDFQDRSIDTSTSKGKLMFQMPGAFAEFENDIHRERLQIGRTTVERHWAKAGVHFLELSIAAVDRGCVKTPNLFDSKHRL